MDDLLAGLQFSHERGVVHRDIKPANVMLTAAGQAKIADFGIARIESSCMTQAGTVLGTPAYMSPEQFMGQVVDARTDIYSSGVLLYQLLTGERPFEGGMSAIMHKALNTEPPAPSQLSVTAPASFDAVVRRAMAKRPEDRFSTAKAFIEAVRAAVANPVEAVSEDEATMVAAPASGRVAAASLLPAASVVQPASRSPVAMIAIAAVVLLAAIGGGAWWFLLRAPVPTHTAAIAVPPVAPAPTPAPASPPSTAASSAAASSVATPPPPRHAHRHPRRSPRARLRRLQLAPIRSPAGATPAQANQPITATVPPPPAVSPPTAPLSVPVATPAPQAVSPTAHAEQQQLAMAGVDGVRRQVADWAGGQNCALLGGKMGDGGSVDLTGLAGDRYLDGLRQGADAIAPAGQIDWRVQGVDQVFCPALNLLHPLVPAFGAIGGPRLGLQMADGKTRLHDGEPVRVQLVLPDFTSRLRVDYVAHDGSVQHLYPQLADPKNGIAADPPRTFAAGRTGQFGASVLDHRRALRHRHDHRRGIFGATVRACASEQCGNRERLSTGFAGGDRPCAAARRSTGWLGGDAGCIAEVMGERAKDAGVCFHCEFRTGRWPIGPG